MAVHRTDIARVVRGPSVQTLDGTASVAPMRQDPGHIIGKVSQEHIEDIFVELNGASSLTVSASNREYGRATNSMSTYVTKISKTNLNIGGLRRHSECDHFVMDVMESRCAGHVRREINALTILVDIAPDFAVESRVEVEVSQTVRPKRLPR